MERPFSQTLEARRLDLHALWLGALALSVLLLLTWGRWFFAAPIARHITTDDVELTDTLSSAHVLRRQGNAQLVTRIQQREIRACFPQTAESQLAEGQDAIVHVGLQGPLRAEVHAVRRRTADCVEVTLLAEEPAGGLAARRGEPVQVAVVRTLTPVQLLLEPPPPSVPGPGPE